VEIAVQPGFRIKQVYSTSEVQNEGWRLQVSLVWQTSIDSADDLGTHMGAITELIEAVLKGLSLTSFGMDHQFEAMCCLVEEVNPEG
jgi:hypothetical protein